ncbi:MAG: M12 family metallo-peptidase, partial [Saprospiraceae bacterium]
MSKNTLRVLSLCSLLILTIISSGFGQKIRFNVQRATTSEDIEYKKQFKAYTIGTLNTKATSDLLRSRENFDALEIDVEGKTFAFDLQTRDIRSENFRLTVKDENGTHDLPRPPNTTYAGYTDKTNYDVRITADDNFFYALIVQGNDEYYIEPAADIIHGAPADQFVMYWKSDVVNKMGNNACGAKHAPTYTKANPDEDTSIPEVGRSRDQCKMVEIALCDDKLMFIKYGTIAGVTNHNMAVINNVLTNYDTEFSTDLNFNIVQVYVVTGTDPWTNSTDPGLLLDGFTAWGPSNLVQHDESSLWTNRDFDGDVIGLAWIGGVCTNYKYNVLQDFTNNANFLRVLQAHEMGHNFNANHDAVNSGFIMAPSVTNTNTWSPTSITVINAYIMSISCLSTCSAPAAPIADFIADNTVGCVPFLVHFFDQSLNNPTSWLWTLPGGTPSTSTMQNPNVTYSTPGVYTVTLKATNAQGMDTKIKVN